MRNHKIVKQLVLGVALAGIWSPQAWAQSAVQSAKPAADTSAADENSDPDAIIVTARRVEETVQDVPMTVNVVTDKKLKDLNLFNGSDLVAAIPGLTFSPNAGQSSPVLALRGAARGEAAGRQDPTVQTYLNEAPVTDVMLYQALYDIGQIEVLRGPQGTLRGRPSAAGAITFTTKRPDLNKITGYVSLAASSLDQLRGEAAISVPIVQDVLAVRLAGIHDENDNDGVRSLFKGQKPYQHLTSWRASVRFKPVDYLDINVMYQDFKSVRATLLQVYGTGYQGPNTPVAGATGPAVGFNGPAISPFDRLSVSDSFTLRDERHQNLIGQINLDLGSHRIAYVGEYNKTRNINSGGTNVGHIFPIPYPDPQLKTLDGKSKLITQEIRLETTGAKFWDYGVGFYYEKNTSDNIVDAVATYNPGTFGNPRAANLASFNYNYKLILQGKFPVGWKNQAVFANSTFHITPNTDLFVGARHVWYEQTSDQIGNLIGGQRATGAPAPAFCGFVPATAASSAGYPSTLIPGQCDIDIFGFQLYKSNPIVRKEQAWVYNASLTQRFTDDMTGYVSFGHSWRPATNNLNLGGTRTGITAFALIGSETSNNYEVGLKMQMMDRKVTVNLAAFYQKYTGFLYSSLGVPYVDNSSGEGAALKVSTAAALATNAPGTVKGFDIELGFRPSSQLSMGLNINYAKGRLSNTLVPCNDSNADGIADSGVSTLAASFAGGTRDINYCRSSAALANQSDWKAAFQGEYNMPVSGQTDGYIRTLISYTPKNNFAPGATTANPFPVDAYTLVNLFVGLRGHNGQWDLGAYARNLFNVNKPLARGVTDISTPSDAQKLLGLAPSAGYRAVVLTQRQEFGATFRFNF
jgi:iron complex outermembrane receptor protein